MNEIERQMLENQKIMMKSMRIYDDTIFDNSLGRSIEKTEELLNPKESDTEQRIKDSLDEGSEKEDSKN